MKKLLVLPLFFSFSFAIKDYMIKPDINSKILYSSAISNYPSLLDNNISSDEYNVFLYSKHFRVIYGKDYNESILTKNLALSILQYAEEVWQKEIEEDGFRPPRNTNIYYIDIYIGNKDAYNVAESEYVSISSNYCGYATTYQDGTPYFVINPNMSLDLIKVTLAHEFFHLVQYAYGLEQTTYDIWEKNIWFLEATATMMEDEVFDDVNDYVNYLKYYIPYTNLALELSNGAIEYGKVIFARYIREKYGIEKIKEIFENYETNETILDDLKKEFDFDNLMKDYAYCLKNKDICFEEGNNYLSVREYNLSNDIVPIYNYGILYFNSGSNTYLNSDNAIYLQEDFNKTQNRVIDINSNGLIVVNKKDVFISSLLQENQKQYITLKKGWNLISNGYSDVLKFNDIEGAIFWIYKDGKYYAYSNDENIRKDLARLNILASNDYLESGEGAWVYCTNDVNISINKASLYSNDLNLSEGWNLVGFSSVIYPNLFENSDIFTYEDNNWSYYGEYNLSYPPINLLKPFKAYFIRK